MAKRKKEVKEKAIEVTLWEAANKLRGSIEPAEYKLVVLGLIFLKFVRDKFEDHRAMHTNSEELRKALDSINNEIENM